jgi:pyrroloquinoline quinone biosynthesis protein E
MTAAVPRPYTLIAELTYACGFSCAYCSNPPHLAEHGVMLDLDGWQSTLAQAAALGVMQVHLSGGEPLLSRQLEDLVAHCRSMELYSNLITSGFPLAPARLERLKRAGLDAVQLSIQDLDRGLGREISGCDGLDQKLAAARWTKELGLPLTLNVVLHRLNIGRVPEFVALAEALGAERLELANAQYLGFAFANRSALLPSSAQIETAREHAARARVRLSGRVDIVFVMPDYHAGRPRACMGGWARRYLVVHPDGKVSPCHAAGAIAGMALDDVRERSLAEIWTSGDAFNCFRGESWMQEPCRGCGRRALDFGGCRCQAFLLTGDPRATDPACSLSPRHSLVRDLAHGAHRTDLVALRRPAWKPRL